MGGVIGAEEVGMEMKNAQLRGKEHGGRSRKPDKDSSAIELTLQIATDCVFMFVGVYT